MFKEYNSKPVVRTAYEIQSTDNLDWCPETKVLNLSIADEHYSVACFEEPVAGDFVVYLDADDVYHCSRKVFAERNCI